jgi:hypothetical protein
MYILIQPKFKHLKCQEDLDLEVKINKISNFGSMNLCRIKVMWEVNKMVPMVMGLLLFLQHRI